MKPARFIPFILAALIAGSVGLNSCKKNYERLMAVKTTSVDASTYLAKGEIIDVGDGSVEYGFCYSTGSNPGINDIKQVVGNTSSARSFQANLASVNPGNTYYVRSYVKGSAGVAYGSVLSFFVQGGDVEYIFDDGVFDYAWRYNAGSYGYMGNLFPVSTTGSISTISIYFKEATDAGQDALFVSVFDASHNLVASTYTFTPYAGAWIPLTGLSIPFSGNFFAMVCWNSLPGPTPFLAEDQDGPYVSQDLAYYSDGTSFARISTVTTAGNQKPGVFLIRVRATLTTKNGPVEKELVAGPGPVGSELSLPASPAYKEITTSEKPGASFLQSSPVNR